MVWPPSKRFDAQNVLALFEMVWALQNVLGGSKRFRPRQNISVLKTFWRPSKWIGPVEMFWEARKWLRPRQNISTAATFWTGPKRDDRQNVAGHVKTFWPPKRSLISSKQVGPVKTI